MPASFRPYLALALCLFPVVAASAGPVATTVQVGWKATPAAFPLATPGHPASIFLAPEDAGALGLATAAFASDVERVTGTRPRIVSEMPATGPVVVVGIAGHSAELKRLTATGKLDTAAIEGKWESALTIVVDAPAPAVSRSLVVAGSDRRGAAFALFALSRAMGVSPWNWWADVPVAHHASVYIDAKNAVQPEPSVQYRGIFLNDEDWGLRPWAAKKMDPELGNIGPHTYNRVFELLLRLHANSLWPAMHPGTLAFNAVPENARLADAWGIVMGSSHSEALLRNNVGEWSEAAPPKGDGPWNYQLNRDAMDAYWEQRLETNGRYENFYTVGLRGVHDTGLEATGDDLVKARLVEQAMADQRALLAQHVNADLGKVPQVIWLYKESLELFRAGMKVPADVTLGWTDDNYGYIRQLPTPEEQRRPGGSGVYYHVSYWGFPHDYLWLCSTPPALIQEEMTKAFDNNAKRYWVLNVGDIKPAEADIDYFMQLAVDEPAMAKVGQRKFLEHWAAEQFPREAAPKIAAILDQYYKLNFVRKPEFMGFNGYNDGVNRTAFNPLAWPSGSQPDQNHARLAAWRRLMAEAQALGRTMPTAYRDAFFELVGYPVEAAAEQNAKFLLTDRTFLDVHGHRDAHDDAAGAKAAYDRIQTLTAMYNSLAGGKWDGMMSAAPRDRQVFKMPATATPEDAGLALPTTWGAGPAYATVSINAAHFSRKSDGALAHWRVLPDLGISGGSVEYGEPGLLANGSVTEAGAWLEYDFTTVRAGDATLTLHLLPTFPLDSERRLRFGVGLDGASPKTLDVGSSGEWHEDTAPVWAANVLRNSAVLTVPLPGLAAGRHTLRLYYQDPGVVFEHIVLTMPGAAPGYPVPPATLAGIN